MKRSNIIKAEADLAQFSRLCFARRNLDYCFLCLLPIGFAVAALNHGPFVFITGAVAWLGCLKFNRQFGGYFE